MRSSGRRYYTVLRDSAKSDFAYCCQYYHLVRGLFLTFVHCAQTAEDTDTISFAFFHVSP